MARPPAPPHRHSGSSSPRLPNRRRPRRSLTPLGHRSGVPAPSANARGSPRRTGSDPADVRAKAAPAGPGDRDLPLPRSLLREEANYLLPVRQRRAEDCDELLVLLLVEREESLVEQDLLGSLAGGLEHELGPLLALDLRGSIDHVLLRRPRPQVDRDFTGRHGNRSCKSCVGNEYTSLYPQCQHKGGELRPVMLTCHPNIGSIGP